MFFGLIQVNRLFRFWCWSFLNIVVSVRNFHFYFLDFNVVRSVASTRLLDAVLLRNLPTGLLQAIIHLYVHTSYWNVCDSNNRNNNAEDHLRNLLNFNYHQCEHYQIDSSAYWFTKKVKINAQNILTYVELHKNEQDDKRWQNEQCSYDKPKFYLNCLGLKSDHPTVIFAFRCYLCWSEESQT